MFTFRASSRRRRARSSFMRVLEIMEPRLYLSAVTSQISLASPVDPSHFSGDLGGNDSSSNPQISADGRFIVFASLADDLVVSDTNGGADIFVYDSLAGTLELVSVDSNGLQHSGNYTSPSISDDGRFVGFVTSAQVEPGDTNAIAEAYVHDRLTGTTTRVLGAGGVTANRNIDQARLSGNGQFIILSSRASNLTVDTDVNDGNLYLNNLGQLIPDDSDLFLASVSTGTVFERVSNDSGGNGANGASFFPDISPDGRFVAFTSRATNLWAGDSNGLADVFIRDRLNGTTELVSPGVFEANNASVSADGRYVAYEYNGRTVWLTDRQSSTTTLISQDGNGNISNNSVVGGLPTVSNDGRYVSFLNRGTNLGYAVGGFTQAFVFDTQTSSLILLSRDTNGNIASTGASNVVMSADGHTLALTSDAQLIPSAGFNDQVYRIAWNRTPDAANSSETTDEDTALVGAPLAISDLDGDSLVVTVTQQPANGVLTINPNGTFDYTPATDFFGPDEFRYTVSDGSSVSGEAIVTLNVTPVNDPPLVANASFTVNEGVPNGTTVGQVLAGDIEFETLTYAIAGGNTGGAFSINSVTGVIQVANTAALVGGTAFTLLVDVSDTSGGVSQGTITIDVLGVAPPATIAPIPSQRINKPHFELIINGSATFDVTQISLTSLRTGILGTENSLKTKGNGQIQFKLKDFNDDGFLDLQVTVLVAATGFTTGINNGILTGSLLNSTTFSLLYTIELT